MTVTIQAETAPANPTTPLVAVGYSAARASRNIIHDIIGQAGPAVSLRPTGLRTGQLTLIYDDAALAAAAVALLARSAVFTLTDDELTLAGMRFVLAPGQITNTINPATLRHWTITAPFQELP